MGSKEETVLWRFAGERDLLAQEDGLAGVLRELWDKQQAVNSVSASSLPLRGVCAAAAAAAAEGRQPLVSRCSPCGG